MFDLDDTLYPERAYAWGGFRAVAGEFAHLLGDFDAAVDEMVCLMDEGHRGRIFNELLQKKGLPVDEAIVAEMVATYRTHRPRIEFHRDAAAALARLKPVYRLGVITDGAREQQWAKIDALGLRELVEEIIVTSELKGPGASTAGAGYGKPHPFAFELIAERFEVTHAECAYVADNPAKDFVAPNSLGWLTVQVHRSDGIYAGAAVAQGGEARRQIDNLDDLESAIEAAKPMDQSRHRI